MHLSYTGQSARLSNLSSPTALGAVVANSSYKAVNERDKTGGLPTRVVALNAAVNLRSSWSMLSGLLTTALYSSRLLRLYSTTQNVAKGSIEEN